MLTPKRHGLVQGRGLACGFVQYQTVVWVDHAYLQHAPIPTREQGRCIAKLRGELGVVLAGEKMNGFFRATVHTLVSLLVACKTFNTQFDRALHRCFVHGRWSA